MSIKPLSSLEIQKRSRGMVEALHRRINPHSPESNEARMYRSMSVLEIAREFYEMQGVNTRGMSRMEMAGFALQTRGGFQGAGDFTSLLADVAQKRLRDAYQEAEVTYTMWARKAPNAPDFRPINVVQLSGAPDLLKTNEHGEFQHGSITDQGETYSVVTYGRIVSLTRTAMVNDDLRGFDRMVQAFGASARRLENRLVYSQLTANGNMADGRPIFHADFGNLSTGAGSALDAGSLSAGRSAMRKQKGLANEELNLAPAYLIVPAALEQTAYQLTSSNYVPSTKAEINEFRQGGRSSLTPVVEPLLDSFSESSWFLAAGSSQVDTVEYCYLDGAEGPVIDSQPEFRFDAVSFRCRLDFAAKAIDRKGLHRSDGQG